MQTQTLNLVKATLPKEDSSFINLDKFARKNDLFFSELYCAWLQLADKPKVKQRKT